MTIRVNAGWNYGIGSTLALFVLILSAGLIFSKTGLVKQNIRLPYNFREILITVSLTFGMIAASFLVNFIQIETFGKSYNIPIAETEAGPELASLPYFSDISVNSVRLLFSVVQEEIAFRWIILGALLMIMVPTRAVIISSMLFAGTHLVVPVLYSEIESGLLSLLPTFFIGLFCGIAFLRHGLFGSIAIHFVLNLCVMLSQRGGVYRDVAVGIICFFAVISLIVLPLGLWFTRETRKTSSVEVKSASR